VQKGIELMVANDVSRPDAGFDVATNAVTLIDTEGERVVPVQSKTKVAEAILDRIEHLLSERSSAVART
jgi:phosphopantothenoylcysteine decarboxylase/phosphopantothenate--cysteine ligase